MTRTDAIEHFNNVYSTMWDKISEAVKSKNLHSLEELIQEIKMYKKHSEIVFKMSEKYPNTSMTEK